MENALRLYRPTLRAQSPFFSLSDEENMRLCPSPQPGLFASPTLSSLVKLECMQASVSWKLLIWRGLASGWKLYHSNMKRLLDFAPCKGTRIPESGKLCLWNQESKKILLLESGILGFGIRNSTQEIWNPTSDWNPESKFDWQIVDSST